MSAPKKKYLFDFIPILLIVLSLVFIAKVIYSSRQQTEEQLVKPELSIKKTALLAGTYYPQLRPVGSFSLLDQDKQEFNELNLKGKWHLIFMGFTHCPHICPTEMQFLKTLYKTLALPLQKKLQITFVTTDPLRDSPEVIKKYLQQYHPDFIGLTGNQEQLASFAKIFGMPFMPSNESDKTKDYEVNHSASFYLTTPQAEPYALFGSPHELDKILSDVKNSLSP